MQFGGQLIIVKKEMSDLPLVILILSFVCVLIGNVCLTCPFILYFYVYGDITAQLIKWASMLKDFMTSVNKTEAKLDKVKEYVAALNHIKGSTYKCILNRYQLRYIISFSKNL